MVRRFSTDVRRFQGNETDGTHTAAAGPLDGVKTITDPFLAATVLAPDTTMTTASTEQPALHGCSILLAEDGPDNQRLIAHLLKNAGARKQRF